MNLTFKWAKQVAVLVSYRETAFSSAFLHARVMKVTALPISRKAGIQEGHTGMEGRWRSQTAPSIIVVVVIVTT